MSNRPLGGSPGLPPPLERKGKGKGGGRKKEERKRGRRKCNAINF